MFIGVKATSRKNDPITSHNAADSVNVSINMFLVLKGAKLIGSPFTDEELCKKVREMGWLVSDQSVRSRRCEAVRNGWIDYVDDTGVSNFGRKCMRHQINNKGLKVLEDFAKEQKEGVK